MRVLHVASGDLWAGAEVMLYNLVRAQRKLPEIEVAAILFNEGRLAQQLRDDSVAISILPENRLGIARLVVQARKVMREFAPDIVHTHRIKEDLVGAVAAALAGGARCVRTVHGMDEATGSSLRLRLSRRVHCACVRHRFEATFAVSRPLAEQLQSVFGAGKVRYIANGLDVDALARAAGQRDRQGSPPVKIGIVGRLVPVKRVDMFLEMAAQLLERAPQMFVFLIYGEGPEAERLQALAQRLGIAASVRFLGFSTTITAEMSRLDMLYVTSDSEGLPMVALEAMVLGIPVVAHAVGELPAVLDHGKCGTLIQVHEPASYAAAALRFLERKGDFLEMAQRARARVAHTYSAEACAGAYIADYRRVLQVRDLAAESDTCA